MYAKSVAFQLYDLSYNVLSGYLKKEGITAGFTMQRNIVIQHSR